ncbi:M48 family metalloprotease [Litchfieldella xinjiangensis]|uniref:M48 family metalloprotease n=1 Tax=Litchfieldella xinjiangensis TaxID=1166948 RepID=UPI0005BC2E59|nr:M48 family metalloprotease [Halomonas xinjiangensis]
MKKRLIPTVCVLSLSLALGGCSATPVDQLSRWLPGGFDENQTYLSQVDKAYRPATTGIGPKADRLRTQSESYGLIDYPALEAFLNRHLDRLKTASGLTGLEGRAYVSADRGFSAKTTADGNIYIPLEMLNDLDNEHEVAALLSHELAHAMLNHNDADLFVRLQKKAVYATAFVSSLGNETDTLPASETRRIRNMLSMALVSDGFLNPGWSRHQEGVADRLGLDLMIEAGYNPEGMSLMLAKVQAWEQKNDAIAAEREANRQAMLTAASEQAGVDLEKQFSLAMGDITTRLNSLFKRFAENHPDIDKRIEENAEYSAAHYRRAARPPMNDIEWASLMDTPRSQALVRSVALIDEAKALYQAGRFDDAATIALSAVNDDTQHQNHVRLTLAEIRREQNQSGSVLANAEYGLQGNYPAYKLHYYNDVLRATNKDGLAASLEQLNTTFADYGKPPQHYKELITLSETVGNKALSTNLSLECELKYLGEAVACRPGEVDQTQGFSYNRVVDSLL